MTSLGASLNETHNLLRPKPAATAQRYCARLSGTKQSDRVRCVRWGRDMRKQDAGFDRRRYRQLLAEAVDENKRLALIALLIEERAMDRLAAQRASERAAMTANTIANVLGSSASGTSTLGASALGTSALGTSPLRTSALGAAALGAAALGTSRR